MDPELRAMQTASEALEPLDQDQRSRVITWLIGKFGIPAPSAPSQRNSDSLPVIPAGESADLGDLFYKIDPTSYSQRALLAAYWFAGSTGEAFSAQAINGLLKDLGFKIPNITDALTQNMREKPALIIQVRKNGSSQQARKQYKITDSGKRLIERLISEREERE